MLYYGRFYKNVDIKFDVDLFKTIFSFFSSFRITFLSVTRLFIISKDPRRVNSYWSLFGEWENSS